MRILRLLQSYSSASSKVSIVQVEARPLADDAICCAGASTATPALSYAVAATGSARSSAVASAMALGARGASRSSEQPEIRAKLIAIVSQWCFLMCFPLFIELTDLCRHVLGLQQASLVPFPGRRRWFGPRMRSSRLPTSPPSRSRALRAPCRRAWSSAAAVHRPPARTACFPVPRG